jgi:uncharacterized protein (TIGR01244 family)
MTTEIRQPVADIYTAGQPTCEQLAALKRKGVRTVINLRAASEPNEFDERLQTERLGMAYVSLPVAGAQDVHRDAVASFSRELDRARGKGAVLVHCASSNRVGAMLALDRGLTHGASREESLFLGRAAGLDSLEPVVDGLLGQCRDDSQGDPK